MGNGEKIEKKVLAGMVKLLSKKVSLLPRGYRWALCSSRNVVLVFRSSVAHSPAVR